jgi:hypothetical protein
VSGGLPAPLPGRHRQAPWCCRGLCNLFGRSANCTLPSPAPLPEPSPSPPSPPLSQLAIPFCFSSPGPVPAPQSLHHHRHRLKAAAFLTCVFSPHPQEQPFTLSAARWNFQATSQTTSPGQGRAGVGSHAAQSAGVAVAVATADSCSANDTRLAGDRSTSCCRTWGGLGWVRGRSCCRWCRRDAVCHQPSVTKSAPGGVGVRVMAQGYAVWGQPICGYLPGERPPRAAEQDACAGGAAVMQVQHCFLPPHSRLGRRI